MSSASTFSTDFYGTPNDAQVTQPLPRKFIRTTDAAQAYWREEVAASLTLTTATTVGVAFTTDSTGRMEFTTASKARVETTADWPVTPGVGTTFNIAGNTTAILSTASRVQAEIDALTTASRLRIESTGNLPIAGNTTAIVSTASRIQAEIDALTTASRIRVESTGALQTAGDSTVFPGAGTTFNVGGQTTALISTASRIQAEVDALTTASRIRVESTGALVTSGDSTVFPGAGTTFNIGGNATVSPAAGSTFNVAGNTTALLSTASKVQVEPGAGATFPVSGNTTSLITTASKIQVETTGPLPISGNTTAILSTASTISALITTASRIQAQVDALTTASKIQVETTAALPIAGNTTVSPAAGTTFNVGGNTTVSPAAGTTFGVRPVATPLGEFTLEGGTTVISTYAAKVSSVAGTTSLMSSSTGRIRVLSYAIQQSDTGSTVPQLIKFLSSGTTIVGAPDWLLGQREGVVEPAVPGGYLFQGSTGEALQFSLSTNVQTMVRVTAVRVP